MTQKKKIKKQIKKKEFVCSLCECAFTGIPYAVVEFYNGLKKCICNPGCYKEFLKEENELLSHEIEDEVLMTPEAIAFQALLERRADFAEILKTMKGEVAGYRGIED